MRISFLINILTSVILLFVIVLYITNYKILDEVNNKIISLSLIAIALGIHSMNHSMEEMCYNFNPLAGKCKTKETFINNIDFKNIDFKNIDFENNFEIKDSKINGVGVISKINIPINTILFKAIENKKILPNARKLNHCQFDKSNTILVENCLDNDWYLKTIKDVKIVDEITSDYNTAPENLVKRADPEWKC